MKLFNLFKVMVACLAFSGLACAQGVGASGDIIGTVTDPSGAVISSGNVTATDASKGIKHTASTDSEGQYHVTGLPPATYNVSVAHSGFQTEVVKGVVVNVGQTVTLDFHLKVSAVSESVEVTTEPPLVETEKGGQSDVINQQLIRDLPINRRDYLTFTLLAPAVTDSTRLAGDQDFRVKQTPQSGLSFYGSNGRGNSVTVDGGETNDDAGGVRLNVPQEAVQEFQINRSNYGADLGGASGASINIVSKSGSNNVHGSLFGLVRNDNLDEANPFSATQALAPGQVFNPAAADLNETPTTDVLKRYQFGGSIGMPITRDKSWFFMAGEGLVQDAQNSVPLIPSTKLFRIMPGQQAVVNGLLAQTNNPVPCLTGQAALPSATCAGILSNLFNIRNNDTPIVASALNKFVISQLEANGGLFAYATRQYLADARFDRQFSEANQTYLHYNFGHDREESPDVQSLVGFSAGSSIHAYVHNLQGNWFHQLSPKTLNEARVQWNYADFNVIPNAPGTPALNVAGFAFLNSNIFLPNLTITRRYEFADNFTAIRGHHTLKFGVVELLRGNHTESHTFFPGRFVFGTVPGGVVTPCFQVPPACATDLTSPLLTTTAAPINALQAFALGIPQFYQQGFGSPIYGTTRPFFGTYFQDTWAVRPNFTLTYGVRYEVDSQYGNLKTPKDNIAPRASFAWDPWGDHKTVIRGGYGIFYSQIYGQIPNVIQTLGLVNGSQQIAQVFVPLTGLTGLTKPLCVTPSNPTGTVNSACIFQVLFAQGKITCTGPAPGQVSCITPADLTQFGINIKHDGTAPLSVFFSGQPDYRSPYSQQAEFGIERQIGKSFSVAVSGIYVHTIGLPTSIDKNPKPFATLTVPLANGTNFTFNNWRGSSPGDPCFGPAVVNCYVRPAVLQDNVYSSQGSAIYEGGILELKKRFSDRVSLMVNYTFSKAFSTSTDFNSDFGPQNNLNLAGERGLSDFDQRHKLVIAGVVESPFSGKSPHTLARMFANFQLAPVFRYNSGHPFNLLAGTDVNGDRHSTNDRPIGVAHNTGVGPDYASFDLRVSRRFKLSERTTLQFIAEGFNIFNTINYAAVNNVVDPNFLVAKSAGGLGNLTANVHGSATIAPNQPLGFTSANPMRQIQFGARVQF